MKSNNKKKNLRCARFVFYVFPLTEEMAVSASVDDLVGQIVLPDGDTANFQSHGDLLRFIKTKFKSETLRHRVKVQPEKFK